LSNCITWVTDSWVKEHIEDEITVLDCQPNVHDYIRGHLPGAIYLSEESVRLYTINRPHAWVSEKLASLILSHCGVKEGKPVLVYTSLNPQSPTGDGVPQCMIAYTLARYGHERILILDGGLEAWKSSQGNIETGYPDAEPSEFKARASRDLNIEYDEFLSTKDKEGVVHIDSRPSSQYQGSSHWKKMGHIPGALNIPWSECFTLENLCRLKPREEIESVFRSAGVRRDKNIICHCGTGRKAAAQLIVLKFLLGFPNVRLFEGSFTEWCAHEDNLTVLGPNPR
jgi:thiosulfate/3-mercaptopyruvate sulfurtransferase